MKTKDILTDGAAWDGFKQAFSLKNQNPPPKLSGYVAKKDRTYWDATGKNLVFDKAGSNKPKTYHKDDTKSSGWSENGKEVSTSAGATLDADYDKYMKDAETQAAAAAAAKPALTPKELTAELYKGVSFVSRDPLKLEYKDRIFIRKWTSKWDSIWQDLLSGKTVNQKLADFLDEQADIIKKFDPTPPPATTTPATTTPATTTPATTTPATTTPATTTPATEIGRVTATNGQIMVKWSDDTWKDESGKKENVTNIKDIASLEAKLKRAQYLQKNPGEATAPTDAEIRAKNAATNPTPAGDVAENRPATTLAEIRKSVSSKVKIKSQLGFFQELVEFRLYYHRDVLEKKTARKLGEVVYLMMLMLEIMRYEKKSTAKSYATETMEYNGFARLRMTTNDLHNLISVLTNQLDYVDKIDVDQSITVPVLQSKRYFRDLISGSNDHLLDRRFFLKLEDSLGIRGGQYKLLRRNVLDWKIIMADERTYAKNLIRRFMNAHMEQRNDLFNKF